MSVLCTAHIAGYTCIHRVRRELGFDDTRVAFATICAYSHRRTRATCCTARRRAVGTVFPGQPVARYDDRALPLSAQEPVCRPLL